MRKKQWIISAVFVALILSFVVYNVFAVIAPEFETAKRLAMTGIPDGDGDYVVGRKITKNGDAVIYMVGYFPRLGYISGCIVAGPRGPLLVVSYDEANDCYFATVNSLQTGQLLSSEELTRDRASEIMSNILKHLIDTGIPI